ncbi:MAG: hypothetical protein ACREJ3_19390 [Polyangiaceae bacterium]
MTPTRVSKPFRLIRARAAPGLYAWLLALVAGCAGATGVADAKARALESAHAAVRLPDAVALDPRPTLPDPVVCAEARGIVSLRPRSGDAGTCSGANASPPSF